MREVPWEDIFKLSASAAASEFCKWVQVGIDYVSLTISIRSSLTDLHGFQLLVLLPLFIEITFVCTKLKFGQASNRCKSFLEAAKHAYANKTKERNISQKDGSRDFW